MIGIANILAGPFTAVRGALAGAHAGGVHVPIATAVATGAEMGDALIAGGEGVARAIGERTVALALGEVGGGSGSELAALVD